MRLAPICALAGALLALTAQSPRLPADEMTMTAAPFSPVLTFHSESNLVQLTVVVRDLKGVPVAGLKQNDFELLVDGKPRALSAFVADETPRKVTTVAVPADPGAPTPPPPPPPPRRPHAVALYFDDLNTSANDLAAARKAAIAYIKSGINPGDKIAVVSSLPAATIDFTTDREKVIAIIDAIGPHTRTGADGGCPLITPPQAYDIVMHFSASLDAYQLALQQALICNPGMQTAQAATMVRTKADTVWSETEAQSQATLASMEALVHYVSHQPGDRTILFASAGFMTPTLQKQIGQLVDAALHDGVVINSIDAKGLYAYSTGQPMGFNFDDPLLPSNPYLDAYRDATQGQDEMSLTDAMEQLAEGTGGTLIENTNALPEGIRQLAAPPEVTYLMGFVPDGVKADGDYHSLGVRVLAPGKFAIQARPGFYAPDAKQARQAQAANVGLDVQQSLNAELYRKDELNDFPARITPEFTKLAGASEVHVVFQVDPRLLAWKRDAGRDTDDLVFVAALLDADGRFVLGEQGMMDLRLKDGTLAAISRPGTGLATAIPITVSPGAYQLRTMIRESGKGLFATATQPVVVP